MHWSDGNLYALAQYQKRVDEDDARQMAIEAYLEDHPDATEDEASDALEAARQDAYDERAADLAWERAHGY